MKKYCLFGLAALAVLSLPLVAYAGEGDAKYNFASVQGAKEVKIAPGEVTECLIYFYNIDGNRITHITLEISEIPLAWEVDIDPPLSDTEVLLSGMPVTIEENLSVEPTELMPESPETVPEGMALVKVPGRGYALGRAALISISAPESSSVGSTQEVIVSAEASWLGQSGTAVVKQARDFKFSVTVVSSSEYNETIASIDITRWWPAVLGGSVAAVGGVIAFHRRKGNK